MKKRNKPIKRKNLITHPKLILTTHLFTNPYIYLSIIILVFLFHSYHFRFFMIDDAFTSFRYAKNLVEGKGFVYNPGERVEGYTNFLWTLIIAIFMKLGFQPERLSQVLGIIFAGLSIFLVFLIGCLLSPKNRLFNLITCLFLCANSCFACWADGGLEGPFFTFLILLAIYRYFLEIQNKKVYLSPILFGISSLTRPEGILFFGITFIHQIVLFFKNKISLKNLFLSIAFFLSIFAPYYLWRYAYYGFPLPNTFYAKVGEGISQYLRGVKYIKDFLIEFSGWIFLAIPFVFKRFNTNYLYFLLITFSYLLYIIYIGGDSLSMYRFLVPILPFLYLLFQEGLKSFTELFSEKKAIAIVFIILAIGIPLTTKKSFSGNSYNALSSQSTLTQNWSFVGKWMKDNISKNASIALSPAGAIPYYSGLYSIDMLGLCDLNISHMKSDWMGKGFAGHEKGSGDYILLRKPTYILLGNIIISDKPEFNFQDIPWDYWALKSERELWFNLKFHEMYEQVASHLGGGWYLHYFRLKKIFS
ncbi:MAG: hypothetical protein AB1630_11235 [bacterium]